LTIAGTAKESMVEEYKVSSSVIATGDKKEIFTSTKTKDYYTDERFNG
jgi:hypothetical protein